MNLQLPSHELLTTRELGEVFSSTTATYKFYWFLSFLDHCVRKGENRISVKDLTISMVAHAWYTVNYFKISFGQWDSLYQVIRDLQSTLKIPMDSSKIDVFEYIKHEESYKDVAELLQKLSVHVPYRFLSPWIKYKSDKDVIARSQQYENHCLYSINKSGNSFFVEINPKWHDYLRSHYQILRDFTYWNLTLFLQNRNPNVPNIPNKLVRPTIRDAMRKQRDFWDCVIQKNHKIDCIFFRKKFISRRLRPGPFYTVVFCYTQPVVESYSSGL